MKDVKTTTVPTYVQTILYEFAEWVKPKALHKATSSNVVDFIFDVMC